MQTSEVGSVNTVTMCLGRGRRLDTQEWFRGGGEGLGNFNFPQDDATQFAVFPAFYPVCKGISSSGSKSKGVEADR